MDWVVYIVRCADNSLYTGITTELGRRIDEHNKDDKRGARYTRSRRPVTVVYQEYCVDRAAASRREHQLKRMSRGEKLEILKRTAE